MQLDKADYLDKVMGCWLGKNAGGTLGMPTEWHRQVTNRLVLELTAANRVCVLLVPVTFLDGNVRPVVSAG